VSLRWLKQLLQHGIRVNGQIVVCPGVNDGAALNETLTGILDDFSELNSVAVVPLGISSFNTESTMRAHLREEAVRVVDIVESWQDIFHELLGRPVVFAADEYYIMAGRPFPSADRYGSFDLHEDGIGMARAFELEFSGSKATPSGTESGFFAWVDGAPAQGYRAVRNPAGDTALRQSTCSSSGESTTRIVNIRMKQNSLPRPIGILTGEYGAVVLRPLIESLDRKDVRVISVRNTFFGGNIAVTGLLVGQDIARALRDQPRSDRYLLPDVCLSDGRFLDGTTVEDLPIPVEVIPTDGIALRRALES
jgi:NifB/MoaA-like Fe-S oxidoreductase